MKWMLMSLVLAAALSASAQDVAVDPPSIEVPKFTPEPQRSEPVTDRAECGCQYQCEAMWAAVPEGLESATHTRVRAASDTFIETYTPYRGQFGMMSGRATKTPDGRGGYRIRGEFRSPYGGQDDIARAERLFYLILNEAAIDVRCPASQTASS